MKKPFFLLLLLAALAGCGGGDEEPADKYAGTWQACFADGASSYREVLFVRKVGATLLAADISQTFYAEAGCAGATASTRTATATFELVGTKSVEGVVADKVFNVQDGIRRRDVFHVEDGLYLFFGSDTAPVDAEGFPTGFDTQYLTRVS